MSASITSAAATTGNTAGASGDFLTGEGNCWATVTVGQAAGALSETVKVQDSTDGTTWNDITGATVAVTTNAATGISGFQRTARYMRAYNTHASSNSACIHVALYQQLKVV